MDEKEQLAAIEANFPNAAINDIYGNYLLDKEAAEEAAKSSVQQVTHEDCIVDDCNKCHNPCE